MHVMKIAFRIRDYGVALVMLHNDYGCRSVRNLSLSEVEKTPGAGRQRGATLSGQQFSESKCVISES